MISKEILILLVIIGVLVAIVGVYFAFKVYKQKNEKEEIEQPIHEVSKQRELTLRDLLDIVSNQNSSKSEITKAVDIFIAKFPFPKRYGTALPEDKGIKDYFNFVFLHAKHKSSDAKMIVRLNKELVAKNESYKLEIEEYEKRGLEARKAS
ncbi:MAG: hypothetical protein HXX81_01755 [Campylobacterales bacterium]|nr:hypothetical protein [Campylobacterales bacterium]